MDLNYKTNLIFPTPIHQFDVNGFDEIQNELIDYAYNLKEKEPEGALVSNRGGWQSLGFEIDNRDDKLHNFLFNCFDAFPCFEQSVDFIIFAWININKSGDYNVKHVHPTNDLSGVIWIKAPNNSGEIVFEAPYLFQAFKNTVDEEKRWAEYLFKDGSMIGLNDKLLHQYVEWVANRRIRAIGFKPIYDVPARNNPLPWTEHWISSKGLQVAPQETEVESYIVGGIKQDVKKDTFSGFKL